MEKEVLELITSKKVFNITKGMVITEISLLNSHIYTYNRNTKTSKYKNVQFIAYKNLISNIIIDIDNSNFKYKRIEDFNSFCYKNKIIVEIDSRFSDETQISLKCNKDVTAVFDSETKLLEKIVY